MAGNHPRDSRGTETGAGDFFTRWRERKRARATEPPTVPAARVVDAPVDPVATVLTDQDMPPLETLREDSDYRGFLSPGVSDRLHRLALRKLFGGTRFQVRDGLDDYDNDYHLLQPLRTVLAETVQDALSRSLPDASQPSVPTSATPPDPAADPIADPAPAPAVRPAPSDNGQGTES